MLVYIILAMLIAVMALKENGVNNNGNIKMFNVALIVFMLVVGLRYWHGDYGTYEWAYYIDLDVGNDAGYFFLQKLFHSTGLPFEAFVFIMTLFSVFAIKKILSISNWPLFGMAVLLGKIFTLYAMSGIRQYLAMALAWWALYELIAHKHSLRFFIMLFIAYTLHGSALILLPAYFFRNRRFSYLSAFIIILLSFVVGKFFMTFFDSVSDMSSVVANRLGGYVKAKSRVSGMNLLNYAENFLFLIMAMIVRKRAKDKLPYYDFFLYMFIIYCGFLLAGKDIGVIKRLRDYYVISYAFIVPGFYYLSDKKNSIPIMKLVLVAYFIFLLFRSLYIYDLPFNDNDFGRMVPYHSIFQKP